MHEISTIMGKKTQRLDVTLLACGHVEESIS